MRKRKNLVNLIDYCRCAGLCHTDNTDSAEKNTHGAFGEERPVVLVMVFFTVGAEAERAYSVSPSQPSLLLVKVREATELLRPFFRAMAFTVVVAFSVMGAL